MKRWHVAGISVACIFSGGLTVWAIISEPWAAPAAVLMGMWAAILWWLARSKA